MRTRTAATLAVRLVAIAWVCAACKAKSAGEGASATGGSALRPGIADAAVPAVDAISTAVLGDATPGGDAAVAGDAALAVDAAPTGAPFALPRTNKQLVTAVVDEWTATRAELRLWSRDAAGWNQVGPAWAGIVGKTGTAWGAGLHGAGAPSGREGPVKREGDGKSPAGVFALTTSFGYASKPPAGTTVGYQQVDTSWKCVDDPRSRAYNRVLDARTTTVDWTSAEEMRRGDDQYAWVVEIAHNATRTPGTGSCIFLHVWAGPDVPTVGCTAMEEPKLAVLLASLSRGDAPAFVLLPRVEYAALAPMWGLPPLANDAK